METITETAITREIVRLRSLTGPQITTVAGAWADPYAKIIARERLVARLGGELGIDVVGLTSRLRGETTAVIMDRRGEPGCPGWSAEGLVPEAIVGALLSDLPGGELTVDERDLLREPWRSVVG